MKELIENNLSSICGLELVRSEFLIKNGRIDTLAFNSQLRAFVIIEYKRDKNYSVIDQGLAYLSLMQQNKESFVLKYNEKFPAAPVTKRKIDWSKSRVIYAAPEFTLHQQLAASYKSINVSLWKVKLYGNSVITIESTADDLAEPAEPNKLEKEMNELNDKPQDDGWQNHELWKSIKNLAGKF